MIEKRHFVVIMLLVLIISIMPSFADTAFTSGQKLQEFGFITGSDSGLMEKQLLTRAETSVILAELMGEKEQAESYIFPANFTDVSGHWAKHYIAYGQSQKWFGGYPDGSYKPEGSVSTQALATYLLNVLGYNVDYSYNNAEQFLKSLGINFDNAEMLTRQEAFDIIWQVVQIPRKNEVVPLGIFLGNMTYDDLDISSNDELKIVSFKSINLFEFQVVFNQPVSQSSAENFEHYAIKSNSTSAVTSSAGQYYLSEDKRILTIYMPWISQNDRVTLTVNDVESQDGSKVISNQTWVTTASDRTNPSVTDAVITGSKAIRLYFSEAMRLSESEIKGAFSVGDITSAEKVSYPLVDGQKYHVVDVTFNSDFPLGNVDLVIDPLLDEADLPSSNKKFSFNNIRETDSPQVIGYELIDRNRLGIIWSKPVILNTDDASDFYHTNNNNVASSVSMKKDANNEIVLYFDKFPLPLKQGYIYVKEGSIKDLWNNRNTFSMTQFSFDLSQLIPVPQRIDVLDSRRIKVNFSTPINETHETSPSNFKLLKDGVEIVVPMSLSFDTVDKDSVTIQFSRELKGDYSLVIEGVKHYDLPSEKATLDFTIE